LETVDTAARAEAPALAADLAQGDRRAAAMRLRRLAALPAVACASLVDRQRGLTTTIGRTAADYGGCAGSGSAGAEVAVALRRAGAEFGRLRVFPDRRHMVALTVGAAWPLVTGGTALCLAVLIGTRRLTGTAPGSGPAGPPAGGPAGLRDAAAGAAAGPPGDRPFGCGRPGGGTRGGPTDRTGAAARVRGIFDCSPAAMIAVREADGRILMANGAAGRLADAAPEDLVGRPLDTLFEGFGDAAAVFDALERGEPGLDLSLAGPRGREPRWAAVHPTRLAGGGPIILTLVDISRRRRTAEQLAVKTAILTATLENMAQGIVMIDRDGRILAHNRTFVELLDLPKDLMDDDPTAGRVIRFQIDRGDFGEGLVGLPPELRAVLADGVDVGRHPRPFVYERRGPGDRMLSIACNPLPDGGLVKTYNDVTGYKRAEATLVQQAADLATAAAELEAERRRADAARAVAEEANRAKSRFLAMMSHELRTPLTAIIGFAEIMRDGGYGLETPERYAEYAADIHAGAMALLTLVNDVLDISRIDAGHLQIDPAPLDLTALLHGAVRLLAVPAMQRGVALDAAVADPPPRLVADERAVKQILFNLVSNAVKFTRAGGSVRLRAGRSAGDVRIAVEDTGVGISADRIERILCPFERLDSGYARGYEGSGLGLTLVRGLVDLHGGSLRIDSEVGAGTTVTVILPDRSADASAAAGLRPAAAEAGSAGRRAPPLS
jgi:two-component system cell cycle sensor histidine kinase PleC